MPEICRHLDIQISEDPFHFCCPENNRERPTKKTKGVGHKHSITNIFSFIHISEKIFLTAKVAVQQSIKSMLVS